MRAALPFLFLSFLLIGCGNKEEASAVTPAATPVEQTKPDPVIPTFAPDLGLLTKISDLQERARKLEAMIPLPEQACFAIGEFEADVAGLRVGIREEIPGAKELFTRMQNFSADSGTGCAGSDLDREIRWREDYLPGIFSRLDLLREGVESGYFLPASVPRDNTNIKSKIYATYLRWVSRKDRLDFISNYELNEAKVADYQFELAGRLFALNRELDAREAELRELQAGSQLERVRYATRQFSGPAARGKEGFSATREKYLELLKAMEALVQALLK